MVEIEEKVAWNLSSGIILELQQLLTNANQCYLSGQIDKMFFTLKAVKMRIINCLSDEERTQLKKQETKFSLAIQKSKRLGGIEAEEYNELIMDKLERYGFLIKKEKDRTNILGK